MEAKKDQKKTAPENKILVVGFSQQSVPKFTENKSSGLINYGEDNNYPLYLLDKFNRSPKHGAIVKGKATYIAGGGFQTSESQMLPQANRTGETYDSIAKKAALDLVLYGGFYLEVIWNNGGTGCEVFHVDYHKVRSDKKNKKFVIKDDWSTRQGEKTERYAFNKEKRTGAQILYFKEYRPGIDTYTLPDYVQSLTYIEADILIADHVLQNANSGFTPSKMIVFTDGEPDTEEEKIAIEKGITKKYTGYKGSKLILSFANSKDQAPLILDLGASDLTKEDFQRVDLLIQQNIFSSHGVTSPMLFGVKTEGQLGGSTELRNAYEVFKNTYVHAKQKSIEEVFHSLFEINGIEKLNLAAIEPVGLEFSESTIAQNMTQNEIREKNGLAPMQVEIKSDSQRMLEALNSLSPLIATKVVEALSPEQLLGLIGVTPDKDSSGTPATDDDATDDAPQDEKFNSQEDEAVLSLFSQVGTPKKNVLIVRNIRSFFSKDGVAESELDIMQNGFADLAALDSKILDLIRKDARITDEDIAKALKLTTKAVSAAIKDLVDKGYVKTKSETVGEDKQQIRKVNEEKVAKAETKEMTKAVHIMYSYSGPYDDRNRPFCARLMELDKVYTRADIESISQRVGYSVWERRGGFYHNPKTGKTTKFCRHTWQQHIVIKRK
ncbi:MAG: winged helix-turn-helix transcriptional regulator [Proteobacteria bacterium]|nr:MAG: winged helix-turn-helix transcriptional regulator [Pseudomonadota bacterium]